MGVGKQQYLVFEANITIFKWIKQCFSNWNTQKIFFTSKKFRHIEEIYYLTGFNISPVGTCSTTPCGRLFITRSNFAGCVVSLNKYKI